MAARVKKTTVDSLQPTAKNKKAGISVDSYSVIGEKKGTVLLPEALFGQKPNAVLIAQAVRVFLSNQRSAHAKVKGRGEIQGSTRKIYKQKGTGGARHGARSAPIFVGGGIAHGPHGIENYNLVLPRTLRKKALISALSARAQNGSISIAEFDKVETKTGKMAKALQKMALKKPLTIYINSEGGDVYAMFKIYDHIRNSLLPVVTIVVGCASSAGFIIFLAGDLRKALPNAVFGFHAPSIYFCGGGSEGPSETDESAIHQNRLLNAVVKIVKNSSNMSEKNIREYFRILTRIDVKTALKFGLVHEIINPPKKILPKSWSKILKEQK